MSDTAFNEMIQHAEDWLKTIPTWFGQRAKATHVMGLVTRGLSDLNRLADAAEKIGSMELSAIGDLVHVGATDAGDMLARAEAHAEAWKGEINRLADYLHTDWPGQIEGSAVDTAIKVMGKIKSETEMRAQGLAPVPTAWAPPGMVDAYGVSIKNNQNAILDFVGWLTTRPGATKFGSAYEVPAALAVAQEYFDKKGWPTT